MIDLFISDLLGAVWAMARRAGRKIVAGSLFLMM
jgi:hypothetical protein